MMMVGYRSLSLSLFFFTIFFVVSQSFVNKQKSQSVIVGSRVVVAAPVLVFLFGGDRYLAANIEAMRLAATGVDWGQADTSYLIRAQQEVAKLNACHEDNYYLANGLLTWGGADREGTAVLRRAMICRFWDELPPFFYGFNQAFFYKDIPEAGRALELAAQRATDNAADFRKLAVMLRVGGFADEKLALNYLAKQRDLAGDQKLREMLDRRVVRLKGLVALREAQRRFVAENGVLVRLDQLVEFGLLPELPIDPLGLGYELRGGEIVLKKMKIAGMENQL